eukprot:1157563-Pelagomonas_calceolata.AAC.3
MLAWRLAYLLSVTVLHVHAGKLLNVQHRRLLPNATSSSPDQGLLTWATPPALLHAHATLQAVAQRYIDWLQSRPFDMGNTTRLAFSARSPSETYRTTAAKGLELESDCNSGASLVSTWQCQPGSSFVPS